MIGDSIRGGPSMSIDYSLAVKLAASVLAVLAAGFWLWASLITVPDNVDTFRSEEHTSELQSLTRISYAVFCLKKKKEITTTNHPKPDKHQRKSKLPKVHNSTRIHK